MKILTRARDWIDNKIVDTLAGKAIDWWQSQHPTSFAIVSGVMITVHAWATTALQEATELCASAGVCMPRGEEIAFLVVYWSSLGISVLSGTKPISAIREGLKNKPKP